MHRNKLLLIALVRITKRRKSGMKKLPFRKMLMRNYLLGGCMLQVKVLDKITSKLRSGLESLVIMVIRMGVIVIGI